MNLPCAICSASCCNVIVFRIMDEQLRCFSRLSTHKIRVPVFDFEVVDGDAFGVVLALRGLQGLQGLVGGEDEVAGIEMPGFHPVAVCHRPVGVLVGGFVGLALASAVGERQQTQVVGGADERLLHAFRGELTRRRVHRHHELAALDGFDGLRARGQVRG